MTISMYKLFFKIGKILGKILPNRLFDFFGFIFDCLYFIPSGNKRLVSKNGNLKGIGKGKRAFILATGPSINDNDLKNLKGEDCFSVSNFFLHDDIKIINPKYHFFAPYHKPLILENYVERLKQSDKILPKDTKIILGHTTKEYVDKYKLFPNREVFYLYLSPFAIKHNYNIKYPILAPQTGPQMILPVLFYMGYSEIYLLGCDHNTLKTYGCDRNDFYDRNKDIRKNAADKNGWMGNVIEELEAQLKMFKQYKYYKTIANNNGVKIINLSENSWLDIFEKSNLKNII